MQVDLDVADRRPPVVVQAFLNQLGEGVAQLRLPRQQPLVIRGTQAHPVTVGREHLAVAHDGTLVRGLPLQGVTDLDRLDLALEHPREGRPNGSFESALETLRQAHCGPAFHLGQRRSLPIWSNRSYPGWRLRRPARRRS